MEQRVMAAKGIVAMAGPRVISRILHDAGADRIKLDIAELKGTEAVKWP